MPMDGHGNAGRARAGRRAGQVVVRLAHAGPREATINLPETLRPAIGSAAQAALYGSAARSAGPAAAAVGRRRSHDPHLRGALCTGGRRRAGAARRDRDRLAPGRRGPRTSVPLGALSTTEGDRASGWSTAAHRRWHSGPSSSPWAGERARQRRSRGDRSSRSGRTCCTRVSGTR